LNAATSPGNYSFIDTGVVGTDEIRVAMIYRPSVVTPVGAHAVLTSAVDPLFIDTLNRPALAQTFAENANGQRFTVVANHLKSKGSDCNAVGDPDTGDGQGNCNITRRNAATALANWLAADPTGSGDPDVLIIGDLNSYAKEDPIGALETAGYTNLVAQFGGPAAYSYVFGGQSGYLDHALANTSLAPQVTGVTEWHINADEPIALDYNTNFKSTNHVNTLFAPDAYRSSDHDPVLVGVCQAPTLSVTVSPSVLRPPNHAYRTVAATPTASTDVVDIELVSATSNEPDNGLGDGDTPNDIVIVDDLTVKLRAERSGTGNGRVYTLAWNATNACGATTTATATVSAPR
jgi:predicted extracellular nuclease